MKSSVSHKVYRRCRTCDHNFISYDDPNKCPFCGSRDTERGITIEVKVKGGKNVQHSTAKSTSASRGK